MYHSRPEMKIRGQRKDRSTRNDFKTHWSVLSSAFRQIHDQNERELSYEQLYRASYQIVLLKQAGRLYSELLEFESQWIKSEVLTVLASHANQVVASEAAGSSSSNELADKLVLKLVALWEDYKTSITLISDVLLCLDRSYCYKEQTYIGDACVHSFRDLILFGDLGCQTRNQLSLVIKDVIFQQLNRERRGFTINRPVLRSLIGMLECMDAGESTRKSIYRAHFHQAIVDSSREFFRLYAHELVEREMPVGYFRAVSRMLAQDNDRCLSILTDYTAAAIQKVINEEMLEAYFETLLQGPHGLPYLFSDVRIDELTIIYDLNLRISDKAVQIANVIRSIIRQMGTDLNEATLKCLEAPEETTASGSKPKGPAERMINRQTSAALKWADTLLQLKVKADLIWEKSFRSSPSLQAEITNGFVDFINSPKFNRAPEYISLFIDANLRKHAKENDTVQFDALLDQFVTLVRFVSSKDSLEMYYKKHLSKRLLMTKSSNIAFEKQVLSRLKQEWGNNATTKLETMFRDIDISQSLTDTFKVAPPASHEASDIQLQINVLNAAAWPIDNMLPKDGAPSCVLPNELQVVKRSFETFYRSQHSGRALHWHDNLGTVDLKTTFSSVPSKDGTVRERKHELNVSMYAMTVLMLFNQLREGESLSYDEIKQATKINDPDLIRNLQSLAIAPKTRVLIKEPMSRDINPTDRFKFNDAFQSPFYKVKIGVVAANKVESDKEKKSTDRQLVADRLYGIQAVIVRIMKHHKTMPQTDLVTQCIQQIRSSFVPDVSLIKKGIEKAIEREFIDVVTQDGEVICNYVA